MYNRKQLTVTALARFIPGILIISALLFIPAGSIKFWNAWLLIGVLFIPMIFVIFYLVKNDPELLHKRLNTKEKEKTQKTVVLITSGIILSGLILSGLDFRFHWTDVPFYVEILSAILVLAGYILFYIVIRQNSYASRVVEVQEKQKVIDTGIYGVVRHPMYTAAIMIFVFIPLLLGSYYALLPMLIFPFQMSNRIKNEEEILEKGLDGYLEYKKKVRYKIIPLIW